MLLYLSPRWTKPFAVIVMEVGGGGRGRGGISEEAGTFLGQALNMSSPGLGGGSSPGGRHPLTTCSAVWKNFAEQHEKRVKTGPLTMK